MAYEKSANEIILKYHTYIHTYIRIIKLRYKSWLSVDFDNLYQLTFITDPLFRQDMKMFSSLVS